jgi:hypothetical protein
VCHGGRCPQNTSPHRARERSGATSARPGDPVGSARRYGRPHSHTALHDPERVAAGGSREPNRRAHPIIASFRHAGPVHATGKQQLGVAQAARLRGRPGARDRVPAVPGMLCVACLPCDCHETPLVSDDDEASSRCKYRLKIAALDTINNRTRTRCERRESNPDASPVGSGDVRLEVRSRRERGQSKAIVQVRGRAHPLPRD